MPTLLKKNKRKTIEGKTLLVMKMWKGRTNFNLDIYILNCESSGQNARYVLSSGGRDSHIQVTGQTTTCIRFWALPGFRYLRRVWNVRPSDSGGNCAKPQTNLSFATLLRF